LDGTRRDGTENIPFARFRRAHLTTVNPNCRNSDACVWRTSARYGAAHSGFQRPAGTHRRPAGNAPRGSVKNHERLDGAAPESNRPRVALPHRTGVTRPHMNHCPAHESGSLVWCYLGSLMSARLSRGLRRRSPRRGTIRRRVSPCSHGRITVRRAARRGTCRFGGRRCRSCAGRLSAVS